MRPPRALLGERVHAVQDLDPMIDLGDGALAERLLGQPPRPLPVRRRLRFESRGPSGDHRVIGRSQIRQQDAPRDRVDHQVMRHHRQSARLGVSGIDPHGPQHGPRRRVQAARGRPGLAFGDLIEVPGPGLHPCHQSGRVHRAPFGHDQPSVGLHPAAQLVMDVQHRSQGGHQRVPVQAGRGDDDSRLGEAGA